MRHAIGQLDYDEHHEYGFDASYNLSFRDKKDKSKTWVSEWQFGLNQGPIILMIENYKSGLIWDIMKRCPPIINGLRKAGFKGGWLSE